MALELWDSGCLTVQGESNCIRHDFEIKDIDGFGMGSAWIASLFGSGLSALNDSAGRHMCLGSVQVLAMTTRFRLTKAH